eukprot:m.119607 g.119607  ORF g.119607 m.119607 type:complete len:718 (+) comp9359_c0_seq6:650-2803(+)
MKVENRVRLVENKFFMMDHSFEQVCTHENRENDYLRDVSEAILYSFMETKDFDSKILRLPLREIVAMTVFKPLAHLISLPDYMNQMFACYIDDAMLDYNAIVDVIKSSSDIDELMEIHSTIEQFIAEQTQTRSSSRNKKDQQFAKILDAMRLCEARIGVISGRPLKRDADREEVTYTLSLQFVFKNQIAYTYFQTFLDTLGKKDVLDCWKSMHAFRINTCIKKGEMKNSIAQEPNKEKAASIQRNMLKSIQEEAYQIYFKFFADEAVCFVKLGRNHLNVAARIHEDIQKAKATELLFDPAMNEITDQLEVHYRKFLASDCYYHCILTLTDSAPEQIEIYSSQPKKPRSRHASTSSAMDLASVASKVQGKQDEKDEEEDFAGWWEAEIVGNDTRMLKKKSVIFYNIKVTYISRIHGEAREWYCYRRYSDFHDFHNELLQRFGHMLSVTIPLPPKKIIKIAKLNEDFLTKREAGLKLWLKEVLSHSVIEKPGIKKAVAKFLGEDIYEHAKPTSLTSKMFAFGVQRQQEEQQDVDATQQLLADMKRIDLTESVPFRIILQLLDVVFKLNSNPWLRRRVMPVVQGLLKTIVGGSINRKIRTAIDGLLSPDQISEWIEYYRESTWPDDFLAPEIPERSIDCCRNTSIEARAKLLGVIPDELKTIIGHDTAKRGILRVFDLFQHPRLNKRLFYVILEAVLVKLLPPPSRFGDLLTKLHELHQT